MSSQKTSWPQIIWIQNWHEHQGRANNPQLYLIGLYWSHPVLTWEIKETFSLSQLFAKYIWRKIIGSSEPCFLPNANSKYLSPLQRICTVSFLFKWSATSLPTLVPRQNARSLQQASNRHKPLHDQSRQDLKIVVVFSNHSGIMLHVLVSGTCGRYWINSVSIILRGCFFHLANSEGNPESACKRCYKTTVHWACTVSIAHVALSYST